MLGNPEIPDEGGVIPRSLEQVFESSQALISQGWKFSMQVRVQSIFFPCSEARIGVSSHNRKTYVSAGVNVGNLQ